ncbi:MAG: hypothetical protein IAE90_14395 [Ignavibacteria bacterium]|nr:hypothetical protein [Ignavibacteria bacterium]
MAEEERSASLLDKAKDAVSNVSEKIVEIKDDVIGDEQKAIMDEFKENSIGKVKQVMEEINNSLGIITKSGYEFKGINVSLGLPPSVGTAFHYKKDIPEAERITLMEEAKDRRFVTMILKCLFKAGDFYHSIKMGDYTLDGVSITLGLTPGVSVGFKKKSA